MRTFRCIHLTKTIIVNNFANANKTFRPDMSLHRPPKAMPNSRQQHRRSTHHRSVHIRPVVVHLVIFRPVNRRQALRYPSACPIPGLSPIPPLKVISRLGPCASMVHIGAFHIWQQKREILDHLPRANLGQVNLRLVAHQKPLQGPESERKGILLRELGDVFGHDIECETAEAGEFFAKESRELKVARAVSTDENSLNVSRRDHADDKSPTTSSSKGLHLAYPRSRCCNP